MSTVTKAIADYSIAVGYGSSTRGKYGISLGTQSEELADGSIAIGYNANAGLTLGNSTWTLQTSDATSTWHAVTYDTPDVGTYAGIPIFVAVSRDASDPNDDYYSVMTSPDGITWTDVSAAAGQNKDWRGITSAVPNVGELSNNTLFVAVAATGSGQQVMTSNDGVSWTSRGTNTNEWISITHGVPSVGDLSGNTTFVAVSSNSINGSDRVMTSQDGINWTTQDTSNNDYLWRGIVSGVPSVGDHAGKTLFVAVSQDSHIMRSEDAISWTSQNPTTLVAVTTSLIAVGVCIGTPNTGTYANQTLFVAVGVNNNSGVIIISNDGYTWTQIKTPGDGNNWESVTSGTINGITIFVATSTSTSTTGIMTSYDGENWFLETTPNQSFRGIVAGVPSTGTYANETIFVSVTDNGSSRVLLSNFSTKNSIAIGTNATTGAENCIAIGNGANAPNANTIILGDGTQNVGIGTSSPDKALHIEGNGLQVHTDNIITGNDTSAAHTEGLIQLGVNGYGPQIHCIRNPGWTDNTDLQFWTSGTNTVAYHAMTIKGHASHGNVGIGTTSPSQKLSVLNGNLGVFNSTHDTMALFAGGYGNYLHIGCWNQAGNTSKNIVLNNYGGNVGIRTNSPRCPLDVKGVTRADVDVDDYHDGHYLTYHGVSRFDNYTTQNVSICADDGVMVSHSFFAGYNIYFTSDERIKTNIIDINDDNALQTLRLIQPKIYNYKEPIISGRSREPVYGFIAQQIAQVLPHAVTIGEVNGSNLDYIPNILSLCKITIENGNQILELINSLDIDDIITNGTSYKVVELNKYTSDFESDKQGNISKIMFVDKNNNKLEYSVKNIISNTKFTLNDNIDSDIIYKNNTILLYGQKVKDFHRLNKDYIFTVATAALQEVDRQLQAEKTKVADLETKNTTLETEVATLKSQMTDLLSRVSALENP